MALEQTRLKFAKRKLRVQRCKPKPSAAASAAKSKPTPVSTAGKKILDPSHFVSSAPKRAPAEHEKRAAELANLPKDERKAAKAADADRLARRMEKKKKRHALGAGVAEKGHGGKGLLGKRKPAAKDAPGAKKAKAPRMRSEKAVAKRNAKK